MILKNVINILIVDDDEGDRMIIKRSLKMAGVQCNILEAMDIDQGLSLCKEYEIDCAIIDYNMPGKTGLEGVKLFKEYVPFLAIVMVTGQGDEFLAAKAFKVGVTDYIPKRAINSETIKQTVFNAIEKSDLKHQVYKQYQELRLFSQVIAHDLSSPIAVIANLIHMLREMLPNENQDKVVRLLDLIERAGDHVNELIKELSIFSSVDKTEIEPLPISMSDVVEKVKNNLTLEIEKNNAKINYGKLPDVFGNETLIVQLMQNMIGNAIKYCRDSTPQIHIDSELVDQKNCICISDNGIGIPKEDTLRIFELFARADTGKEFSGTGLGLATCKKIVERHNGRIWCESEVGKGSVFRFTLGME